MSILSPTQVVENIVAVGKRKVELTSTAGSLPRMILSGALAGSFIALGGLLALIVSQGFPGAAAANPSLPRLLSGFMFPIGLILVVFMGTELFTGNNALLIPALLRREITPARIAVNWTAVYFTNMLGAVCFTILFAWMSGLTDSSPYREAAISIATAKVSLPWSVVFIRGIGANLLVCLAIWLGQSTTAAGARMFALWLPVMAFVVFGMEHSIANMFYLPLGMLHGAGFSLSEAVVNNLIPATLGNIVGGALFVGAALGYLHSPRR